MAELTSQHWSPVREQMVDPETGKLTAIWERYFNKAFKILFELEAAIFPRGWPGTSGQNQLDNTLNSLQSLVQGIQASRDPSLMKRIEDLEGSAGDGVHPMFAVLMDRIRDLENSQILSPNCYIGIQAD